jgi:DNA-binding NtrC family response regulator
MWQELRLFFLTRVLGKHPASPERPAPAAQTGSSHSRITIVSILLEDRDRSLIAEICGHNQWDVFFAKTCAEACQASEQLKPHIILLDRDLADGNWRSALSACASSAVGACTMLISRVADDYLWNEVVCNGGYDVLAKPLREQDVLRAVRFAWSYLNSTKQTALPKK